MIVFGWLSAWGSLLTGNFEQMNISDVNSFYLIHTCQPVKEMPYQEKLDCERAKGWKEGIKANTNALTVINRHFD